jgi:hypothetical protein
MQSYWIVLGNMLIEYSRYFRNMSKLQDFRSAELFYMFKNQKCPDEIELLKRHKKTIT